MNKKLYTIKWIDHNGNQVTLKSALLIDELPKMIEALVDEGRDPEVFVI